MNTPMSTPLEAVRASGITVTFSSSRSAGAPEARRVLDDVSLEVRRGEILAIVGPNGSGKTSLVGVLAGDLAADSGEVSVLGRPIAQWRLRELARERAVLTQEQRVAFPFRVREVVRMGRAPWRGRPEEDYDDLEVAAAMETASVGDLAERAFGTLSGGEKGRTSFARLLAQQTGVLMLDEPTAALDLGHQEQLLATTHEAARRGAAVAVVLHDLTLAAAWADRILVLEQGRVAAVGAPPEVLDPALLSRVYQHPVEVVRHPQTGDLLVLADRRGTTRRDPSSSEVAR